MLTLNKPEILNSSFNHRLYFNLPHMHDCLLFLLPRCIMPYLPPAKDAKATSWAQHAELVSVVECNNCCEVEYPASLLLKVNIFTFSIVTLGKKKDTFVPKTVPWRHVTLRHVMLHYVMSCRCLLSVGNAFSTAWFILLFTGTLLYISYLDEVSSLCCAMVSSNSHQ